MSYDKYRNWKSQDVVLTDLKEQVIKDLEETVDPIEKLEILDSFEVYVRRDNGADLAEYLASLALRTVLRPLLIEFAKANMPGVSPIGRPRMASPPA